MKDKVIHAILPHSNVGLTMNVSVKMVGESQAAAMDKLGATLETYTNVATNEKTPVN